MPGIGGGISQLAEVEEGNVLIAGNRVLLNSTRNNCMVRMLRTGARDTTFHAPGGTEDILSDLAAMPDGRIMVCGRFPTFIPGMYLRVTRLLNDGSIDADYTTTLMANDSVLAVAQTADGGTLIGGAFQSINGVPRSRLAKLDANGALDPGLTIGTGFNASVRDIAVLGDGRIAVGGNFTEYNGQPVGHAVILSPYGDLDLSFVYSLWLPVERFLMTPTDHLIVISDGYVRQLDNDGSVMASFDDVSGYGEQIYDAGVQGDGRVIIAGDFSHFDGTLMRRIARIDPDGELDIGFDPGSSFNNHPSHVLALSDDKILVTGGFQSYQGQDANTVCRLHLGPVGQIGLADPGIGSLPFAAYPCPANEVVLLDIGTGGTALCEVMDMRGKLVQSTTVEGPVKGVGLDVSSLAPGPYLLYIMTTWRSGVLKLIVE